MNFRRIIWSVGLCSLILFGFYTIQSASSTREAILGASFLFIAMMSRLCCALESR